MFPIAEQLFLDGIGFDLEYDDLRQSLFVSIPALGTVEQVALDTMTVAKSFAIGGSPRGIDLGPSNDELAIALNGTGEVAFLDPDTSTLDATDVSDALGDTRAHDVVFFSNTDVFMSADASFSSVIRFTRAGPAAAIPIADDRILGSRPELVMAPDGSRLFVGENHSPASLVALDITLPDAPIVLEDEHGRCTARIASH